MVDEKSLPLASVLNSQVETDLASLYSSATSTQRNALLRALRQAHEAGQSEAEKRTGRIIASVLAPLLGVPQPDSSANSKSRLRGVLSAVRNLTV